MEFTSILGAGVGGAIGGAVGGLLAQLALPDDKRSSMRLGFILVPALILAGVGREAAKSDAVQDLMRPPTRLERAVRKYQDRFMSSEKAKRRVKEAGSPEAARALGEQLSHAGLKRLSAADLDRWNELRLRLALDSPVICAGFWTGRFDKAAVVPAALEKLKDPDLDDWARITSSAMLLEVEAEGAVPEDPEALTRALQTIVDKLPAADADRMRAAVTAGLGLADDEACWAIKTILRTASTLDDAKKREDVIRTLAAL